jgi:hypothetical protein
MYRPVMPVFSLVPKRKPAFKKQWRRAKAIAQDAIVFFATGDTVTAFNEDAMVIARELGIFCDDTPIMGMENSIQFMSTHFEMYARLLRAAGFEDLWKVDEGGACRPIDEVGGNFSFTMQTMCQVLLGKRKL